MMHDAMTLLYQDATLIVVEKPSGLLAVPGRGPEKQDCVVNRVKALCPDILAQPAVHRLDMYTSGLMVLAKTREAHRHLSRQFEQRQVNKTYIALLAGILDKEEGEIRLSFRLDPNNRPYQVYDPVQGKEGISRWRRMGVEGKTTRVEFTPLTGRTHQLRVHAAHPLGLGMPIIGDRLYGSGKEGEQMLLHAAKLGFQHPDRGTRVTFSSKVPF